MKHSSSQHTHFNEKQHDFNELVPHFNQIPQISMKWNFNFNGNTQNFNETTPQLQQTVNFQQKKECHGHTATLDKNAQKVKIISTFGRTPQIRNQDIARFFKQINLNIPHCININLHIRTKFININILQIINGPSCLNFINATAYITPSP